MHLRIAYVLVDLFDSYFMNMFFRLFSDSITMLDIWFYIGLMNPFTANSIVIFNHESEIMKFKTYYCLNPKKKIHLDSESGCVFISGGMQTLPGQNSSFPILALKFELSQIVYK